ncbi:MAG TPA: exodeoxyribonuclease V subunit gamma [Kofleriaceae bacterium]|nr:exodeoxyribonuclease V subunit gamma [Kofleriaceae bacterium]
MLRVVRSNRSEALLAAVIEALPAPDPFAPSTIVVGSHLVARWLGRELAFARGIAIGVELVTFDRFVEATWACDPAARAAGLVALDRRQLAAALASVLADERTVRALPPVAAYLAAAPGARDRAGPRRVQLAEHLAELVWQYALARPDWMPALIAGHVPGELASDDTARWQARLLGEALARLGDRHAPVPLLPWLRRRAGLPAPALPRPVSLFGVSYLVRAQLEALTDLASTTPVTAYLLDPCEPLWDDAPGRARAQTSDEPLPLALWGRAVKATLGALVERSGGDVDGAFVRDEPRDARRALLGDVLERRGPAGVTTHADAGVTVLACPSVRREIELVAAEVRARLDADPALRAHDIAVWIASDHERYLAQAPSAFDALGVPCHLIDAPIDDRGRIGEVVLAMLELPTCAMTRSDLLRVMTHPAVLAGHPHVDADDWVRWTERLGIVHGADERAHLGTYLADHRNKFHWDQGVRRLALGAYMVGGDRGPVAIGGLELAPEEVRPEQQASAATYALLVRSLCADAAWLAGHEATLAEWADLFVGLVDAYLARRDGEAARDVERVRAMLAGIARVDLDGRRVGFREAREHAIRRLVHARADRGEPLAAGVMIAPLAAMRALPFRHVFVVGLAEGAFPAADQPAALDVRHASRALDVSPRDRDRDAFLEVLLGARGELWLSYVAVEPQSGQPLGPSSVVLELADALAPYLGAPSSRAALDQITRRAPLHRFTGAGELPPAIAREKWAVRVRDAIRARLRASGQPVPDEDGMLALIGHPSLGELRAALGMVDVPAGAAPGAPDRPLSLANLRAFLEAPVQAWAQAVLGLDELPDEQVIDQGDEPFHVDRPARALLLREVLAAQLREPARDPAAIYDHTVRDLELRGQFPVGVFGAAARAIDLRALARWRAALAAIPGSATRLAFGRSSSPVAELRPALDLELSGGRTVRLVGQTELLLRDGERATSVIPMLGELDKRSRHHLRGALDHVVLAAAGLAPAGHTHVLLGGDGRTAQIDHEPWTERDARGYLGVLIGELLDAPHGYLLPFDALVRALVGGRVATGFKDPTGGLGYGPIERPDGLAIPRDATAIARRRLGPLASRMRGPHGLGGDA